MNYSLAIKIVRAAKNISQQDLAQKIEMDPSTVSLLERGLREPSMKTLRRIALELDVPVHLLVMLSYPSSELESLDDESALFIGKQLLKAMLEGNDE